jgi:hypothetical protein
MMFGAPSWSEPGARERLGPVLGGQRPNAGLGPRSSVQPTSAGGIPSSVGVPAPPATLSAADLASPPVTRCADPPAARTGPGMNATLGTRSAVGMTRAARGGGDRRQLNPWAASRCEVPLPTLQRPPWRAVLGREDAGLEKAFGESRIQCLLSARRTQPPRTRLGQRRTRGVGMVSPWRFLPPGAAPASGRATAPRSGSPGVC